MVLSMQRWNGKVAIVTGASSGIGTAIADALVENGLMVVGVARRLELLEERAKNLSGKKGKLYPFKADITIEEEVLKLFEWTSKNLGPVHILINNAGKSVPTTLIKGKKEEWKSVIDLNILALCVCTKEAVSIMKENQINGHIIHINSVLGHKMTNLVPFLNVYPATKYAVTALTETLRQEFNLLGLKIKITSVSPGFVESEMTTLEKNISERKKEFLAQMPMLIGEDIADAVVYALSTPEHVQVHELMVKPIGEQA